MKKWVALALTVSLLSGCASLNRKEDAAVFQTQGVTDTKGNKQIKVSREQVYQGKLILVNADHPIRQSAVQSDVVNLYEKKELRTGFGLVDNSIRISQSVAEAFGGLVRAAAKDKITHFMINSGYRNQQEQKVLYQEMGSDYALPAGHSEHNTGLALDIGSTQGEMNQAPEGKWLRNHAWKYGFILRYPKDKVDMTGIQFEPWHFRYVGLPHSAIMQQKGMVLEEYWDYVMEQKDLSVTVEGKSYELHYYPVSQSTAIPLPSGRRYEISGNNMEGVLVTVFPKSG
jgi:zinc D-Ala-D-Ala carboxypeptidase